MTTDIEELKRLHAAATPGEWNLDREKNEGDYGSGDPDEESDFEKKLQAMIAAKGE